LLIIALIVLTTLSVVFLLILGLLKLVLAGNSRPDAPHTLPAPFIQVLCPVKGVSDSQDVILRSLLNQSYPNYIVSFIIEDEFDPIWPSLQRLGADYPRVEVLISGRTSLCGQKNHGLAFAAGRVRSETEIVVTCDGNSIARPDWLDSITRPIRQGTAAAVTTFRTFNPKPATLAGVCQAIYGAFLSLLIAIAPKPWGGSTAIKREVFDRLNVSGYWRQTVVDDLVLGNVLSDSGEKICFSLESVMETPLTRQSFTGFIGFLDRQILFPKFTNPGVWISSMIWQFMLTVTFMASLWFVGTGVFHWSAGLHVLVSAFFLFAFFGAVLILNRINPHSVPKAVWLVSVFPLMALLTYVYLRSIFSDYIDWSGKRYHCGQRGLVTRFEELSR
jgi:cellulose synthase/poly-beta-1,6-N-acetylglucosamine synthase-like glycosyltransferase